MQKQLCSDCQYFSQHYTFNDDRLFQVYCGHCTHSRVKHKRPDANICVDFVLRSPKENSFVSKEYLSKKLLQRLLDLEFFPEIEE